MMASRFLKADLPKKYLMLANSGTNYAYRMNRLSNRIFGEVVRSTNPGSMRVVQRFSENPLYQRPEFVVYYPRHVETYDLMHKLREYGLFRDEHEDFREEMERLRTLRGKGRAARNAKYESKKQNK